MKLRIPERWRPLAFDVGLVTVYGALAVVITWPGVTVADTHLLGNLGDGWQCLFNLWWMREAITTFENPFFTPYMYHPDGVTLLFHTFSPYNALAGAALSIGFDWILSYNLLVLLHYALGGYGMYRLASYLTGDRLAAVIVGALFTLSPFHVAHSYGHLQLMAIEWVPFALLYMVRTFREPGVRNPLYAALFVVLSALSSWYFLIYLFMFGVILAAGRVAAARREALDRRLLGRTASMVGAIAILLGPLLGVMMYTKATTSAGMGHDMVNLSADIMNFFFPGQSSAWADVVGSPYQLWTGNSSENSAYLGYVLLGLAVAGIVRAKHLPFRFAWGVAAIFFIALSLGPHPHWGGAIDTSVNLPYAWLNRLSPTIFGFTGCPVRASFGTNLAMCLLAAGGLSWWRRRPGRARPRHRVLVVAVVGLLAILEFWPGLTFITRHHAPRFFEQLSAEPADYSIFDLRDKTARVYSILAHRKPVVDGHVSRRPARLVNGLRQEPFYRVLKAPRINGVLPEAAKAAVLQGLRARDVRYIVRMREIQPTVEETQLGYPRVFEDRHVTVFRVPAASERPPAAVPHGIVQSREVLSYWKLDEGEGGITRDSANGEFAAEVEGPSWTEGKVGSALEFDGFGSVDIGYWNFTDAVSVEAWVRPAVALDGETGGRRRFMLRGGNFGLVWLCHDEPLTRGRYGIAFGVMGENRWPNIVLKETSLEAGTWYHLAATLGGGQQRLYINGQPVEPTVSRPLEGRLRHSKASTTVVPREFVGMFRGAMDEVALFDRVLTPEEIALHYERSRAGRGYFDAD